MQATIDELRAAAVFSEATVADLEQCMGAAETTIDELNEKARAADIAMEAIKARMQRVSDNCIGWIKYGEKSNKIATACQLKANAWDEQTELATNKLLEDALRTYNMREKIANLARLAGINVLSTDTYNEIRKKVLLRTHSDKHNEILAKEVLFEKICKKVNDMPSSM